MASHTQGKKKANPLVIPSVRFTKLIIHHLQSKHKFHLRPDSLLHLPYEEYVLGYLKFSAKGTKQEVFGMLILNELITDDIRGGQYYNEYLEKASKHKRYLAGEEGPLPPVVFREPDPGRRQPLPEVHGKRKEKVIEEQAAHTLLDLYTPKKKSTTDQYILQRCTPKTADPTGPSIHHEDEKAIRADGETNTKELLTHTEKSGEEVSNTVVLGTEYSGQDEKQGGPDPDVLAESRPLPFQEILTGSSLNPMDEGLTATAYLNVQENLKLTVNEHEILEEPTSSTGTLSSLQHLDKDFSFGDQFFNDKPSEAENEKT
nr:E-beta-farnesene synthase [Tanacetum cinerariifolium]